MGVKQTVTWTCDRCSRIDEGELNYQPQDWGALRITVPALADLTEGEKLGVLCFGCRCDLAEFLSAPPPPEPG